MVIRRGICPRTNINKPARNAKTKELSTTKTAFSKQRNTGLEKRSKIMGKISDRLALIPQIKEDAIFLIDRIPYAILRWETGERIIVNLPRPNMTPSELIAIVNWLIENEEFELSDFKILSKMREKITEILIKSDVNYKESIHE